MRPLAIALLAMSLVACRQEPAAEYASSDEPTVVIRLYDNDGTWRYSYDARATTLTIKDNVLSFVTNDDKLVRTNLQFVAIEQVSGMPTAIVVPITPTPAAQKRGATR